MSPFLLLFDIQIIVISLCLYIIFSRLNQNIDKSQQIKHKTYSNKNSKISDNYSEFGKEDIDKDVDEMPDDCLIYDELFDE